MNSARLILRRAVDNRALGARLAGEIARQNAELTRDKSSEFSRFVNLTLLKSKQFYRLALSIEDVAKLAVCANLLADSLNSLFDCSELNR